jgi:tetratricopeptide (TPR) repeat protein
LTDEVLASRADDPLAKTLSLNVGLSRQSQTEAPQAFFDTIAEMEKLVALHPDDFEIRITLARQLQTVVQYERASAILQAGLERDPLNARLHFELGRLRTEAGDLDGARAALLKSLEIEPNHANAFFRLAVVSFQEGDGVEYLGQLLNAMQNDPRDHELPGTIAGFLYSLNLVEEGDDFRRRVLAMAPESTIAYKIDLLRALATGNEAESVASARRTIRDDIEDRQAAFSLAVQHLMRLAARDGTVAETEAFVEQHSPGALAMDAEIASDKNRVAQIACFDAWYVALPRESFLQRLDHVVNTAERFGIDVMQEPRSRMIVEAFRGNTDAAIRTALDGVLSQSVTSDLAFRQTFAQAQFRDVVADQRVANALAAWDAEYTAIRESVRDYLLELSSAAPAQANAR